MAPMGAMHGSLHNPDSGIVCRDVPECETIPLIF